MGRNHQENERIRELGREKDLFLKCLEVTGPLALLEGGASPEDEELTSSLVVRYGKTPDKEGPVPVKVEGGEGEEKVIAALPAGGDDLEKYRVG